MSEQAEQAEQAELGVGAGVGAGTSATSPESVRLGEAERRANAAGGQSTAHALFGGGSGGAGSQRPALSATAALFGSQAQA